MNTVLPPALSRRRIALALVMAAGADTAQFMVLLAGPAGYLIADVIDVVVMVLMTVLLGFHPLFLPTFVAEFLPVADLLPTWTGCAAVVIALRRKQQRAATPPAAPPPPPFAKDDVIDI